MRAEWAGELFSWQVNGCMWPKDSPQLHTDSRFLSHLALSSSKGCHAFTMYHFLSDAPVYMETTSSCSDLQELMVLWKESYTSSLKTRVSVPAPLLRAMLGVGPFWGVGPPSIIRKFIFSFNNLWLLFPFTDGVTNYIIIGFPKTSYLLFGSISKTQTWLSLILTVGLPEEKPNGRLFQHLKQILCLLFQGHIDRSRTCSAFF